MGFVVNKRKLLAASVASFISLGAQAAPYDVIDLGTLGGIKNFAFAINGINEVVGTADGEIIPTDQISDDNPASTCLVGSAIFLREFCDQAYIFRNDAIAPLGQFNVDGSFALSINDSSTVVGYALEEVDNGDPDTANIVRERGFISYDGAAIEPLPFPPESLTFPEGVEPEMRALYISNDDKVLGYALVNLVNPADDTVTQATARPYVYDIATDTFQLIPLFVSDEQLFTDGNQAFGGNLRAMNSTGQITGWANVTNEDGTNSINALFWDPASPDLSMPLGTLGGFSSQAYDLNDNGYIVGVSETDENFFRNEELAFIYDTSSNTMTQIPEFSTIAEYTQSRAYSINNSNMVVGSAQISANNGTNAAFLYEVGTEALVNLNDMIDCELGWNLVTARGINEDGYIVGTGTFEGEVRSFMLVPTADTTPTNCTKADTPDNGGDSGSDSSGGSLGFISLTTLFVALFRRRLTRK